jgi:hypothetical protein
MAQCRTTRRTHALVSHRAAQATAGNWVHCYTSAVLIAAINSLRTSALPARATSLVRPRKRFRTSLQRAIHLLHRFNRFIDNPSSKSSSQNSGEILTLNQAGVLALRLQNKTMLAVENPGNPDVALPAQLPIDAKC